MKYIVTINGKNYEVEVERGTAYIESVSHVAQQALPTPQPVVEQAPVSTTQVSGEPIKAPLPGIVMEIKVQPGESVKQGDILLVLEAMKMENEVLAPRDGVVSQVLVSKGANVETDDSLLSLK